ncbi:MAG: PqqD family protein [Chloroflexi bacterium]|nr:PqqD family protein [Chloroflexota bacterium]
MEVHTLDGGREPVGANARIESTTILRRGTDVPFSQLDDEFLAIDAQAGRCYSLNETAGRVWDLIATPMSLDAVCAQLREEYEVDETTCQREVIRLLQRLDDAGLLQVVEPAAG